MPNITKKITTIFLIMCCAFTTKAQNIILNGSFELNTVSGCYEFLYTQSDYNNTVSYSTSYGYAIMLHKDSCLRCSPPTFWGGGGQEGNWMAALVAKPFNFPTGSGWAQSKLSLELDYPLSTDRNYKLSFYIKEPPDIPLNSTGCLESPSNYVNIGISNIDTAFGTHLYTSPLGDSIWKQYSVVFNTQNAEQYITVETGIGDTNDNAVFVDNFVLVETTEQPNAVYEVNGSNKQLLKVVDILGKEALPKQKGILFYIYSDGTVEKRIAIE